MTPDPEHWEKLAAVLARDNSALADELVRHGWTQDCDRCAALIEPDDAYAADTLVDENRILRGEVERLLPFVYQKCPACGIVVAPEARP